MEHLLLLLLLLLLSSSPVSSLTVSFMSSHMNSHNNNTPACINGRRRHMGLQGCRRSVCVASKEQWKGPRCQVGQVEQMCQLILVVASAVSGRSTRRLTVTATGSLQLLLLLPFLVSVAVLLLSTPLQLPPLVLLVVLLLSQDLQVLHPHLLLLPLHQGIDDPDQPVLRLCNLRTGVSLEWRSIRVPSRWRVEQGAHPGELRLQGCALHSRLSVGWAVLLLFRLTSRAARMLLWTCIWIGLKRGARTLLQAAGCLRYVRRRSGRLRRGLVQLPASFATERAWLSEAVLLQLARSVRQISPEVQLVGVAPFVTGVVARGVAVVSGLSASKSWPVLTVLSSARHATSCPPMPCLHVPCHATPQASLATPRTPMPTNALPAHPTPRHAAGMPRHGAAPRTPHNRLTMPRHTMPRHGLAMPHHRLATPRHAPPASQLIPCSHMPHTTYDHTLLSSHSSWSGRGR